MKAKILMRVVRMVCCLTVMLGLGLALGGNVKAAEKELVFGIVEPLSGAAAPWGITAKRSFDLGAEDVNNQGGFVVNGVTYKWKTIAYDSKMDPKECRTAVERLVNVDGAKYLNVLGTGCLMASEDILLKNNVVMFGNVYGGKKVTNPEHPFWYRSITGTTERTQAFYPYLKKKHNIKKIALIAPDSEGGASSIDDSRDAAKVSGLNIVATESFESGTTDFYPIITKILKNKPDMIDTTCAAGDEPALIIKQARELGFKGVMYIGTMTEPKGLISLATPKYAEGAYIAGLAMDLKTDMAKRFRGLYEKKYGKSEWNPDAYEYAHVIYLLTTAFKKANSIDTTKISKTTENMEFASFTGTGRFGGEKKYGIKRQIVVPDYLAVIKNGNAVHETSAAPPKGY